MDTNKKSKAIVLGATGNVTFAVGNVLLGIKRHSPNFQGDFIVLNKDMSDNDKEVLTEIYPCRFVDYEFPQLKEYDNPYLYGFTTLTFSRYEIFSWLDEYEAIAWLDIDTLVLDGPLLIKRLEIEETKKIVDDAYCGHVELKIKAVAKQRVVLVE